MPGGVAAQRASWNAGDLAYCAEAVAKNESVFEFGPFVFF